MKYLFILLVAPFVGAWGLMVEIGIVHAQILDAVHPVGYSVCLGLSFFGCLIYSIIGVFSGILEAIE